MKDLDKRLSALERAAERRRIAVSGDVPVFICDGPDDEARVNAEIALQPERVPSSCGSLTLLPKAARCNEGRRRRELRRLMGMVE